jgi:arginine decarboxylase
MYQDHFAMRGDPAAHHGPTVFATHSTHKLLAALSQASYIHVRDGKGAIDHHCFNQAYMMHTTTSPLYAIVASNDITSAMMGGSGGRSLTQEAIEEAVDFRQVVGRLCRTFAEKNDWFFKTWNVETVKNPANGKKMAFEDAPADLLCQSQAPWMLHPSDKWHGFDDIAEDWCMLDPIKVSLLSPGMGEDGKLEKNGVPAAPGEHVVDRSAASESLPQRQAARPWRRAVRVLAQEPSRRPAECSLRGPTQGGHDAPRGLRAFGQR